MLRFRTRHGMERWRGMADEQRLYDLVVMGSSAGGIEALALLVTTLPPDFPAPIVIAQHLDPSHPSHLGEILARRSTLPVHTVPTPSPRRCCLASCTWCPRTATSRSRTILSDCIQMR
jgi:chemotaxis response regulator CheB